MEVKINFQRRLEEQLQTIGEGEKKPSLLLHSCCGPCSSYVLDYLKDFFQITVFYYNPNIDPETEYLHRLSEQERLIREAFEGQVSLLTVPYDHSEFTEAVKGQEGEPEGGARCKTCFRLRLEKTARMAKEGGFDFFGTTLTVSPHKNAMVINAVGHETEEILEAGARWLESDFKKKNGYQRSIQLSNQYHLYRQNYCGCEFARTT